MSQHSMQTELVEPMSIYFYLDHAVDADGLSHFEFQY